MTRREYKAKGMHWSVMCESQRDSKPNDLWHSIFNLMGDVRRRWGNGSIYKALRNGLHRLTD